MRFPTPAYKLMLEQAVPYEQARREMIGMRLTASSAEQYAGRMRILNDFKVDHRKREGVVDAEELAAPITKEEFLIAMNAQRRLGRCGSTFEGFRAALLDWALAEEHQPTLDWIGSAIVRECLSGARRNGGEPIPGRAPPRGAISFAQLETLLLYVVGFQRGTGVEYARGIQVAWFFMLRHGELQQLRPSHLRVDPEWGRVIDMHREKRRHEGTAPRVVPPDAYDFFDTLAEYFDEVRGGEDDEFEQPMFPGWNEAVVNSYIRRVARADQWRTDLSWSHHALRHGSATHQVTHGTSVERLMRMGGWLSNTSAEGYCRPR